MEIVSLFSGAGGLDLGLTKAGHSVVWANDIDANAVETEERGGRRNFAHIHQLFDSGHLRIHSNGGVFLTDRARMDYGALIPPSIQIPDWINRDFVRWRWENYNGV